MTLDEMLAYRVAMLSGNLSESLYSVYAPYDLTMPQWRIMATLGTLQNKERNKGSIVSMTAKQLVKATRLDKVTVTRALQQMERHRLIDKRQDTSDGRAVNVSLSTTGQNVYLKILPNVIRWQEEKLASITDSEYQIFLKVIDKLTS
ncbi:MarR family winged helix-turn-helix transcriptional regulator [Alteromonas sp. 009811495]|uniref:MarR family winged helix-turn-helix transcriptional regulator n=1 Tax=Alteromonas sp. 009811495 TaxID=3002962 RepID=UPI00237D5378|nr:MarR family transcriptional regulator [Alteromonas sp. 009811495]WDT87617.1 MarR family transcriptional regulator [Alteromonas sp. 009811495]